MAPDDNIQSTEQFEIGAVSKITGISAHRLRIWERRYNNLKPGRSDSGRRLYSSRDVQKLVLIKSLLDAGHSIGMIAELSVEELENKVNRDPNLLNFYKNRDSRITIDAALYGFDLVSEVKDNPKQLRNINLDVAETDYETFKHSINDKKPDLLILEFETLDEQKLHEIYSLLNVSGASHAILIYWFCESKLLDSVNRSLVTAVRGPTNLQELSIICQNTYDTKDHYKVEVKDKNRIYSVPELAKIASYASLVKCECPHQLVSLLYSLNSFEKYSLECENRNLEDAKLHRFLYEITGQARLLIEKALSKVVEIEDIRY